MRNYLVVAFITLSLSSFSQSVSFSANYPVVQQKDHSGIVGFQFQWDPISTKNNKWEFGINLDGMVHKRLNESFSNLVSASLNIEHNIAEPGPALGLKFVGNVGCYYEHSQNGITLGFGILFDRIILEKTQFARKN